MNHAFLTLATTLLASQPAPRAADVATQSIPHWSMEDKAQPIDGLGTGFLNPPPAARPWVYWFWINGNISKMGITAGPSRRGHVLTL
jgi:hypothetical protein